MKLLLILILIGFSGVSKASDKHEDPEHEHEQAHQHEPPVTVSADKGITEIGELGFKISTQALKTFALNTVPVQAGVTEIPNHALVKIKDTKSVFRFRDNWYKRIPVTIVQKKSNTLIIKGDDLKPQDQIVTAGVGFLRTAEIFSEEGATHSH